MQRQRKPRTPAQRLALFLVAVVAVFGGYYWGQQYAPKVSGYLALSSLEQPTPVRPLRLLDQSGQPFSQEGFKGHWNLVLFGYTRDEGNSREPLTLITQVVNRLADNPKLQGITRAVFITLDPDHDQPQVLHRFIRHYNRDFLALTGAMDQITSSAGQLGVSFKRQPNTDGEGYRIEHSTSIALIDPDANLVGLFTGIVDAVSIASDLKQLADSDTK